MTECSVCMSKFTVALRKKVTCPYCPYEACAQCHQTYLTSTPEYAHCMNCRKEWSREVLAREFTNSFVNKTYKEHRENSLFERERSLMPETQPYVEIEIKCAQHQAEIEKLNRIRAELATRFQVQSSQDLGLMGKEDYVDARIERLNRTLDIQKKIAIVDLDVRHNLQVIGVYRNQSVDAKRKVFVRACPADGCRGFLSTGYKCGMCEVKVCSRCHEIKDDDVEHVCDPNNVATAELLNRDSKACPRCAAMIFKISGCDQMYCTQCQTAFSWRTGNIETGAIHNPHYYDYMRNHGGLDRAPGDVVCGGLPDIYRISRNNFTTAEYNTLHYIHQNVQHMQYAGALVRYRAAGHVDNRDIRIKYMMNVLTEEEFKRKLQAREKAENRKRDIRQVLEMYVTVVTDIFQRLVQGGNRQILPELDGIRAHTQELLTSIGQRWKCAVPYFVGVQIR